MKSDHYRGLAAALLSATLLLCPAGKAVTNTVPWSDSFEAYPNGTSIVGTNGWTGDTATPSSGTASTDPAVIALLMSYTNTASYPLSATHTTVLRTTTMSTNGIRGATGGVVAVEFMMLPSAQDETPPAPTNLHYAFFVDTNLNLVIWHQNRTGGTTNNEWRALTNGPTLLTNAWSRFTVVQDYQHNMFQIRVNESTNAVVDQTGWSGPNGTPSGSWFYMAKTNAWLSHVMLGGDDGYFDDLLLTRRSVIWSTNSFVERVANDGFIDTNTIFDIGVRYDTFAGTNGQVLDAGSVMVTNLPPGLTGTVTRQDATHLRLTVTGQALPNEATNGVTNMTVVLKDSAFTLGNAADVVSVSNNTIVVALLNKEAIAFDSTHFVETAANDGSIGNTLTLSLITATFTNGPLVAGTHYTVTNVPQGLAFSLTRSNAAIAVARLTGNANAHRATNSISNLNLTFLDAAFAGLPASRVLGSSTNLAVDFADPPVLTYSGTNFIEAVVNNGTIGNALTATLVGDTFTNTTFVSGLHYAATNVPGGLMLNVAWSNNATVVLSLSNAATRHAASNSVADIGFTFLSQAFEHVAVSNMEGTSPTIGVTFSNPPVLATPGGAVFVEAAANNGVIANNPIVTLTGTTFTNAAFVTNTHYTVANVPAGLVFGFTRNNDAQLTATLSGTALSHRAVNSISNLTVTFLDAAFTLVQATNIVGHPLTFAVTFSNQPALTYSKNEFMETSGGFIDNRTPMTITLSGDTFAADAGSRVAVSNLPAGLAAAFTRDTATRLSVRLNGAATSHAGTNSISNMTFTFQADAFGVTTSDQVDNYLKNNLKVTFVNDTSFFNVIPYAESFEGYTNGLWLAGTNGWTADYYSGAGIVTNDAVVAGNLMRYLRPLYEFPIVTNHAQVLTVNDDLRVAIRSEAFPLVYLDFMTQPSVTLDPPDSSYTNMQYAFYVNTNRQLTVWHHNRTGNSNEWLTLQNSPLIDTSSWARFTVEQNYTSNMFQLRINEGQPIVDPAGWTEGGLAHPGSWFYMVQTNGTMSHFIVSGNGQIYLDDLTVRTSLPATFGGPIGVIFKFR